VRKVVVTLVSVKRVLNTETDQISVVAEVELEDKPVDWDRLGWVNVQCFNVVDHYEYLKKNIRERFMMLVTHCTHRV
jgi:hypothetical protein